MTPCCEAIYICDFDGSNVRCYNCDKRYDQKEPQEKNTVPDMPQMASEAGDL